MTTARSSLRRAAAIAAEAQAIAPPTGDVVGTRRTIVIERVAPEPMAAASR